MGGAENIDCSNILRVPNKLFCQYHSSGELLLGLLQQLSNYGEAEMDDDGVLSVVVITRVESRVESDSQRSRNRGWKLDHRSENESFLRTIKRLTSWF